MFSSFADAPDPDLVSLLGDSVSGRDMPKWEEPGPQLFTVIGGLYSQSCSESSGLLSQTWAQRAEQEAPPEMLL